MENVTTFRTIDGSYCDTVRFLLYDMIIYDEEQR